MIKSKLTESEFELQEQLDRLRQQYEQLSASYTTLLNRVAESEKAGSVINEPVQLYKNLFNLNPLPMWIFDFETLAFIEVNEAAIRQYGYTREEFLQMTIWDIRPVEEKERLAREGNKVNPGSSIYRQKWCHLKKNGSLIHVEVSAQFVIYNGKKAALVLANDITESKLAQEALQQSNERFEYVTKATFDAIWDWDILNDRFYWGEGYGKIFGYVNENSTGNTTRSFENIHPDDRRRVFDGIDLLITGGEENWTGEYRYRKADGEYAYVQDKAIIIRDDTGKAVRMIGAMQDTTARKLAEVATQKTQKKFNALVNAIDGIVWEANADSFDFTYVSRHAEKLLGYPTSQWTHEPGFWAAHIHPDDREKAVSLCTECTKLMKEHQFEYRMIAADGRVVWLADFVSVVVENNRPVQLRGIMVDISVRKKAEEELTEKNLQLKNLSSHLQHVREEERKYIAREVHDELGQLASVVKMDIDWLKIKMPGLEGAPKARVDHASDTSDILLNSIRKMASDLRPGMLDELGLIASLDWQCKQFARVNGIPCVFNAAFDDVNLTPSIKNELFRICQESLTNITRHAKAANVTVTITEKNNMIVLQIIDDGIGFHVNRKKNTLGIIGMRERAHSVNGQLKVISEPGNGTTIWVTVPNMRTGA